MRCYENIFIARQDLAPSQVEALTETFSKVIKDNGGKVKKAEYCGLRPLAYPIEKNRKGHYVLLNIEAPNTLIEELERNMRIREDIIRYLTIQVESHDEGPSPLLKQSRTFVEGHTRGSSFHSPSTAAQASAAE